MLLKVRLVNHVNGEDIDESLTETSQMRMKYLSDQHYSNSRFMKYDGLRRSVRWTLETVMGYKAES